MRLRNHLLRWLLLPLAVVWAVGFHLDYARSIAQANEAYDRTLAGSALAIAERVMVRDGAFSVDLPYAALEMLETRAQDRVFYKVSSERPVMVVTGHEDLPGPAARPAGDEPSFEDARYRGEAIRMVAIRRPLYDERGLGPLLVQVAETTAARQAMSTRILLDSVLTQITLIAAAALLITFGVRRGLEPLRRIRNEIAGRDEFDLTPIDAGAVPREVAPLIEALNLHTERQRQLNDAHRQFIADASHQLKTPLTVLKTQAALALQQQDVSRMRAIVAEIHDATDLTARTINQLLSLARSEPGHLMPTETVDLVEIARAATFDLLPQALHKDIELGFEDGGSAVPVQGQPLLLRELVSNLTDNAIRYTPRGGCITVSVHCAATGGAQLQVEDNGPGIAPEHRRQVFDRFYRVNGALSDGCGLGLAIVRQICERHGATAELHTAASGKGLRVAVQFP
jgi:two-component system sensor histidine kinase TctE